MRRWRQSFRSRYSRCSTSLTIIRLRVNSQTSTPFTQVTLHGKRTWDWDGWGRLTELPGRPWADGRRARLGLYSVCRSSVVDFSKVSIELEERTHTHTHGLSLAGSSLTRPRLPRLGTGWLETRKIWVKTCGLRSQYTDAKSRHSTLND